MTQLWVLWHLHLEYATVWPSNHRSHWLSCYHRKGSKRDPGRHLYGHILEGGWCQHGQSIKEILQSRQIFFIYKLWLEISTIINAKCAGNLLIQNLGTFNSNVPGRLTDKKEIIKRTWVGCRKILIFHGWRECRTSLSMRITELLDSHNSDSHNIWILWQSTSLTELYSKCSGFSEMILANWDES